MAYYGRRSRRYSRRSRYGGFSRRRRRSSYRSRRGIPRFRNRIGRRM